MRFFAPVLFCAMAVAMPLMAQEPAKETQAENAAVSARAERMADFMICYGILMEMRSDVSFKKKVEVIYPQMIREYEAFIAERPGSDFADDAKLRIAEIYNLSAAREGEEKLFPYIRFNDKWLAEANKWLTEIVAHHKTGTRFDFMAVKELNEPAAALALYYLGMWNRSVPYLQQLVDTYPDSEPARWALERLERVQQELQKKKQ